MNSLVWTICFKSFVLNSSYLFLTVCDHLCMHQYRDGPLSDQAAATTISLVFPPCLEHSACCCGWGRWWCRRRDDGGLIMSINLVDTAASSPRTLLFFEIIAPRVKKKLLQKTSQSKRNFSSHHNWIRRQFFLFSCFFQTWPHGPGGVFQYILLSKSRTIKVTAF